MEAASCLVFEEHIATEALRRAAASCASEMPCARNAPRVVVFTVEGERHTLGLSLEDLVLVEAGWRVVWVGEGPPLAELKPADPQAKTRSAQCFCIHVEFAVRHCAISGRADARHLSAPDTGRLRWRWTVGSRAWGSSDHHLWRIALFPGSHAMASPDKVGAYYGEQAEKLHVGKID
jgi:hypothetical protein